MIHYFKCEMVRKGQDKMRFMYNKTKQYNKGFYKQKINMINCSSSESLVCSFDRQYKQFQKVQILRINMTIPLHSKSPGLTTSHLRTQILLPLRTKCTLHLLFYPEAQQVNIVDYQEEIHHLESFYTAMATRIISVLFPLLLRFSPLYLRK